MTAPVTIIAQVVLNGGGFVALQPVSGQSNDSAQIFSGVNGSPQDSQLIRLMLKPEAAALFPQGDTVTLVITPS